MPACCPSSSVLTSHSICLSPRNSWSIPHQQTPSPDSLYKQNTITDKWINAKWSAPSWLKSSVHLRAQHQYCRCHGFNFHSSLNFVQVFFSHIQIFHQQFSYMTTTSTNIQVRKNSSFEQNLTSITRLNCSTYQLSNEASVLTCNNNRDECAVPENIHTHPSPHRRFFVLHLPLPQWNSSLASYFVPKILTF